MRGPLQAQLGDEDVNFGWSIQRILLLLARCYQDPMYREKRPDGILDQEVDKLALLYCDARRDASIGPRDKFIVLAGRHGPGLAGFGQDQNNAVYLLELIADRQQFTLLLEYRPSRTGRSLRLVPRVSNASWDRWRAGQVLLHRGSEANFIEEFVPVAAALEPDEVIAFGRNRSWKDTKAALDLTGQTFKEKARRGLTEIKSGDAGWSASMGEAWEIACVAGEKSRTDPDRYEAAHEKVARLPRSAVVEAILKCRQGRDTVWNAPEIAMRMTECRQIYHVGRLLWLSAQAFGEQNGQTMGGALTEDERRRGFEEARREWPAGLGVPPWDDLEKGKVVECEGSLRSLVG